MNILRPFVGLALLAATFAGLVGAGRFSWMAKDSFDQIMDQMTAVTAENCWSKPRIELELPEESVSQVPVYNKLLSNNIHANRPMLLHLHNMALNRAFYYSFIFQRMNMSMDHEHMPGLMYLYMSAAADVSANPGWINGSSLLFDNNCTYPNWYTNRDYHLPLQLFGPTAWRADANHERTDWLHEATTRTVEIEDYATGRSRVTNYTDESYKYCPYTRYEYDHTDACQERPKFWWPDNKGYNDSLRKFTYTVGVKFSNQTGKFTKQEFEAFSFYGPLQPGQSRQDNTQPVLLTQPYFDCGRSNRWIVSMTSPVVDYIPRYSHWNHLRRPRFAAVVGMDAEFERIDINQCPTTEGNPPPNIFANTHRCRPTTMCEPVSGFGFRRGGYQCLCLPGFHYPWWHDGPFQGWQIEQATRVEYDNGAFDCFTVENNRVPPLQTPDFVTRRRRSTRLVANKRNTFLYLVSEPAEISARKPASRLVARRTRRSAGGKEETTISPVLTSTFIKQYHEETPNIRRKRETFDETNWRRMEGIHDKLFNVTRGSCKFRKAFELYLSEDAAYGADKQFEAQGRTALRLAHFLSNFLQNIDEYEEYGNLRGDRRLNYTHIFGEVLASVMGDFKVLGAGVYFDRYKYRVSTPFNVHDPRYSYTVPRELWELFGPFAWREQNLVKGLDTFKAIDAAGLPKSYVDETWFRQMKLRWLTNYLGMKTYVDKPMIRSGPRDYRSVRFEHYPITYKAPSYEDGEWSRPYFRCDDMVMDWVITYSVPFFGFNSFTTQIEFKGVVSIDVQMKWLDINQCPADSYIANAFKNTAKCDFKSQYCVPLLGRGFEPGSYKCECRQGYEHPFNNVSSFFHGHTMEEEYTKLEKGDKNRYGTLKCRIAGAASVVVSWALVACTSMLPLVWNHSRVLLQGGN